MMTRSSGGTEPAEGTNPPARDRDDLEGTYTRADSEDAEVRTVHGQYTGREGEGPTRDVEGTYIGTGGPGEEPLVRDSRLRHGNYPKGEHDKRAKTGE